MGFFDGIEKIKLPNIGNLIHEGKDIKTQIKKIDINGINVRYWNKDCTYYTPTKGIIYRYTNVSLVIMKIPEKLGVIIIDNTIHFNKFTKEEELDVIEGFGFTVDLSHQPILEKELSELKTIIAKKEIKDIKNYTIPAMINKIPVPIVRVNLNQNLGTLPDYVAISQKFLYEISMVKILQKVNKQKHEGLFIVLVLGIFIGIFLGSAMMGYILR